MEVLVIDGGSTDKTLEIAKNFPVKILHNKKRDAESGKSLGIENSCGEIIALVDADNELASSEWLVRMVQPLLDDPTVFGVESIWQLRRSDPAINRYSTYLQISDPFARHLSSKPKKRKQNGYLICSANTNDCAVTGANGFLWKKDVILEVGGYKPKFEEANFVSCVIGCGFGTYAEVPMAGTYHYHVKSIGSFIRKRIKIGKKFLRRVKDKQKTWVHKRGKKSFLLTVLFCASIVGPAVEAIGGYKRTKDIAWYLHPFMSFLTIAIYGILSITRYVETFWY